MGVFWPYAVGTMIAAARGQSETAHQWLDALPPRRDPIARWRVARVRHRHRRRGRR